MINKMNVEVKVEKIFKDDNGEDIFSLFIKINNDIHLINCNKDELLKINNRLKRIIDNDLL